MYGRYQSELIHALESPGAHAGESAGTHQNGARLDVGKSDTAMLRAPYQPQALPLDLGLLPHAHGAQLSSEDTEAPPTHSIPDHAGFSASLSQGHDARVPLAMADYDHAANRGEALSLNIPYLTATSRIPLPSFVPPHDLGAAHAVSVRAPALELPPRQPQFIPAPSRSHDLAQAPPFGHRTPGSSGSEIPPGHRIGLPTAAPPPPSTLADAGRQTLSESPPFMYRCQYCPKAFLSDHGFRVHQRAHEGPKPYKCPVTTCGRTFTTRPNAMRHLTAHGDAAAGLHILRLTTRVVSTSTSGITQCRPASLRPLTQGRVLPPPSRNPLPPASLLAACATSTTRASRYPLRVPDPASLIAPCPLPPVRRRPGVEERDSWDSPPTDDPYHPVGWLRRPVLPGPAIEADVARELNLEVGADP
ncbi:hypothetical protein AURDEDRAFT_170737 [Auricularia subglabra TFB-10046 SS5]|uniref:C2H2-type domain-containing protein n=1 Tax=Auricularia subglabra (strain TFB-10046 / SS5) TaxID=717982 RepID=J0WWG0_AURST|nr:hypothetical protein AURDEDRAFT_170737 [Auricularia subglabra TFB-10046 SS5]